MKYSLMLLFTSLIVGSSIGQKSFEGYVHYKAKTIMPDTNVVLRSWNVGVFTNDTIVRVETETGALGIQVYIRHISLKKAYLLVELDTLKFAVQTDLLKNDSNQVIGTNENTAKAKYSFSKKRFRGKKIKGVRCRCYQIRFEDGYTYLGYFAKNIENKYLEVYSDIPGLALRYELQTADGITKYEAVEVKQTKVNRNLFGIPSDYKRVSFEELLKEIYKQQ